MTEKSYKIIEFDPTTASDEIFDGVLDCAGRFEEEKQLSEPRIVRR